MSAPSPSADSIQGRLRCLVAASKCAEIRALWFSLTLDCSAPATVVGIAALVLEVIPSEYRDQYSVLIELKACNISMQFFCSHSLVECGYSSIEHGDCRTSDDDDSC